MQRRRLKRVKGERAGRGRGGVRGGGGGSRPIGEEAKGGGEGGGG